MTSPITTRFTLREGQNFTACTPSNSCTGNTKTTYRSRDGELEIRFGSDGRPSNATFYYPSKAECNDSFDPIRNCDLEATFEGKDLQELRDSNTDLAKYWQDSTDEKQQANTQLSTDQVDRGTNNLPQISGEDVNWLGFPNILFAIPVIVLIVTIGYKALKPLLSPPRNSQKNSRNRQQVNPSYQQAAAPLMTVSVTKNQENLTKDNQLSDSENKNPLIATQITVKPVQKLAQSSINPSCASQESDDSIDLKIKTLSNRVDILEQEVTSLKIRGYRSTDSPNIAP